MKRYLGIDLGGCMSGTSAYCLIEGDSHTFRLISSHKEPKHKNPASCADYLYEQITQSKAQHIGIDAPLSIPKILHDSNFVPKSREGSGEIINPYLFRYTDYLLFKEQGLRPMPPAGDRIGRITARAIELLHRLKKPTLNEMIWEVYPKQIALALGLSDYKKKPQIVLKTLGVEDFNGDEHEVDALLAAYATMMIDHGHTHNPPDDETEGWCYILKSRQKI